MGEKQIVLGQVAVEAGDIRELRTETDIGWLEGKGNWMERYYISSADQSAEEFYRNIRGHWSIENRLHWSLDVVFREDAALVSRGHGPENLNMLRKTALSLLRAAPDPRPMGKKRMTGPK